MRRREFLTIIGGLSVGPVMARAQQIIKARIGYLADTQRPVDEIFRQSLRELGYIEGSNLTMICRWAAGGSFQPLPMTWWRKTST